MTRIDFDPAEIGHNMFYFFLNSVVVPRPIAWVSTRSSEGVDNLAPHSFFTVSSVDPPIVQFTSVSRKDSLKNIEQNGEFVVCLAPAYLMAEVNATGTDFPSDVSEFDAVGLQREPSLRVTPPPRCGIPNGARVQTSQPGLVRPRHSGVRPRRSRGRIGVSFAQRAPGDRPAATDLPARR